MYMLKSTNLRDGDKKALRNEISHQTLSYRDSCLPCWVKILCFCFVLFWFFSKFLSLWPHSSLFIWGCVLFVILILKVCHKLFRDLLWDHSWRIALSLGKNKRRLNCVDSVNKKVWSWINFILHHKWALILERPGRNWVWMKNAFYRLRYIYILISEGGSPWEFMGPSDNSFVEENIHYG